MGDAWLDELGELTARGERCLQNHRSQLFSDAVGAVFSNELAEVSEKSFWIIPGLLSTSRTLLYGESKAGKSFLVANLVYSAVTGTALLGKQPLKTVGKALILSTDTDGDLEYKDRLDRLGIPSSTVLLARVSSTTPRETWDNLPDYCASNGVGLVVVDHANGVIDGDTNEVAPWQELWNVKLGALDTQGVAVVVVHHSSDSRFQGAKTHRPMGSSATTQFARARVELDRPDSKTASTLRRVRTLANNAEPENIECYLDVDTARFEVETATRPLPRSVATLDRNKQVSLLASESRGATVKAVAEDIADRAGVSVSALERRILPQLVRAGLLVKKDDPSQGVYTLGDIMQST